MTKFHLQALKNYLPRNWASILANKHNLSQDMIRKIIRGERINIPVLEDATSLAEQHRNQLNNIAKRIKQIA